jgi:ribonuclease P protein subunit POP4
MKITPDIIRFEFIGTGAEITRSSNGGYVGLGGIVVGETRNTFTLISEGKTRNVIKEQAIFNFKFGDGTVAEIDGKLLVGRPEDRLKKSIKRLW